jgi:hypothetical protein
MIELWEGSKYTTPFSSKLWKVVKFHSSFVLGRQRRIKWWKINVKKVGNYA